MLSFSVWFAGCEAGSEEEGSVGKNEKLALM